MTSPSSNPLMILLSLPKLAQGIHWTSTAFAAITVGVVYTIRRFRNGYPASLIALVVISGVAYALKLEIPVIGDIPRGLPKLHQHDSDAP
ncbi:MAG: hypothetical protein FJW20_12570 [Acidimicrobiia bacterium]|nr:hypothetical protein [Acidimicrobiia bacterium]